MHHERIRPCAALLLRRGAALARSFAERGRPGERKHVEIKLPGLILARILRCDLTNSNREPHRQRGARHATAIANHPTTLPLRAEHQTLSRRRERFKNKGEIE